MSNATSPRLEEAAREFVKTIPRCCGYPKCDGDLEGEEHSEACPLAEGEMTSAEILIAFARQRERLVLLEAVNECDRRAEAHWDGILVANRYAQEERQACAGEAKEIAAWLRAKAEQGEKS